MEEETNDENEVLKFKVKSLEALVSMEGRQGDQVEQMALMDEMVASKRDL